VINKLSTFYCILDKVHEILVDEQKQEDAELVATIELRKSQPEIDMDWDELFNISNNRN
jgi:hypothetical protein